MPSSREPYRLPPLVALSLLVLIAAIPSLGRSPKRPVTLDDSQVKGWPCLKRRDILRDGRQHPRWFNSDELMARVVEKRAVERPGGLGKNHLRGYVTIQVVVSKDGKVVCARGVEGHPLGIASAVRSLRRWSFRPYVSNGKRKAIAGALSIPYDFSE